MTRDSVYHTVQDPRTVKEAVAWLKAAGLDLGADAVRRWCRNGRVPALKLLNGEWYIPAAAIEAVIRGQDPHKAVEEATRKSAEGMAA